MNPLSQLLPDLTGLSTANFLADLKSADLVGISWLKNLGLRLDFTFGPDHPDYSIELYQIVHFIISQPVNSLDHDDCFWVGEVTIEENPDETVPLSSVSYPFTDSSLQPLVKFSLVGDLMIQVWCHQYQLFKKLIYHTEMDWKRKIK